MRRPRREFPAFVVVGLRLQHVCKCEAPTPGEYTITRIAASRKTAWARNSIDDGEHIIRALDVMRTWGERYGVIDTIALPAPAVPQHKEEGRDG